MIIIPAIDLKCQKVVRFTRGRTDKKIYSDDPLATAWDWQKQGAGLLHLVDLDGAMTGKQKNLNTIKAIVKKLKIPVEVGGGIRSIPAIRKILGFGARRVVLGTRAIENISFLKNALKKFGSNRIVLGLDASGDKLGLYGWKRSSHHRMPEFLKKLKNLNLKTIIYTDINRDGTLSGVDIKSINKILTASPFEIIVSGGISSLTDIKKLAKLKAPGLKGIIIGKALYEKRFSLKEAIAAAGSKKRNV